MMPCFSKQNSPILFAVYIDTVIITIQNLGLGCHVGMRSMSIFMYADDLVLISGSLNDLQFMVDVCIGELNSLDLLINAKKSICIRIGKNFKTCCSVICIDSFRLQWSDKMVYLGITILSSTRFSIDLKPSRSKFYRSFNALYCKISKSDVFLIVSLSKSFCMPLVMFSLEAINLNASRLNSIDSLILNFNAFWKIFKTQDRNSLKSCMFYMNCWLPRYEYFNRRLKFLHKLNKSENMVIKTGFVINGKREISNLCDFLNIDASHPSSYKSNIWNHWTSSIEIL